MTTEKILNRYSIASFDWDKSLSFAREAQRSGDNSVIYEALLFSAIVCYYRPFSPNEVLSNTAAISKIKIEDFSPLSLSELEVHEKCKLLRNKALSHSEYSYNPTRLCEKTGVISSRPFSLSFQKFDLELFIQLVEKLERMCHHKRANFIDMLRN